MVIYDIEKWKKSVYNIGVYFFNLEDADASASVRFPFLPWAELSSGGDKRGFN